MALAGARAAAMLRDGTTAPGAHYANLELACLELRDRASIRRINIVAAAEDSSLDPAAGGAPPLFQRQQRERPAAQAATPAAGGRAPPLRSEAGPTFVLAQPALNGRALEDPVFLIERDGEYLLPADFLAANGIRSGGRGETIRGRRYEPAGTIASMRVSTDERDGSVHIECGAECFKGTTLSAAGARAVALSRVSPGGFINYDLFAQTGEGRSYGGFAEAGVFSNAGTGLASAVCANTRKTGPCVRLETNWTIDDPSRARRLRLGDTVTQAARWGAPARFGGVKWGTDYSLQPGFITFPTPTISGEAALPGAVEVIIADTQRFKAGLPAGPFSISDIPVVTGAGAVQVAVTDLLGRETVISTDYYAAPQLLKPGLSQYSAEAGFLREDFGLKSNAYDEGFVAGGYARGVYDWFTIGARSEISRSHQTVGASGAFASHFLGVLETDAAMSIVDGRAGGVFGLRHERRSSNFSFGGDIAYATADFRRFGEAREAARLTARSFLGYNAPRMGGASVNWTYRDERAGDDFSAIGAQYSKSLGRASLFVSVLKIIEPDENLVASVTLSAPFGRFATAAAGANYDGSEFGGEARFQKSPPIAGGFGYHARIAVDGVERYEAGAEYRSRYGDASAIFSRANDKEAGRFGARGGVAVVAGEIVAAPSITDSIAVVSVGEERNVRVYHDRQIVGRTGKDGRVVIPRLRAFESNRISFEADDVGFGADFRSAELAVTPGLRTGHVVRFDVERRTGLIVRIMRADGEPIVSGEMRDMESGETYPVGRSGRVYVPDAPARLRLRHEGGGFQCEVELEKPDIAIEAPYHDLGAVECRRAGGEI